MVDHVHVLVLVHFQRDFFGGGALPLKSASAALAVVNNLRSSYHFDYVFVTMLVNHANDQYVSSVPGSDVHTYAVLYKLLLSNFMQVLGGQQPGGSARCCRRSS